jgi:uncharacterized membrane protein
MTTKAFSSHESSVDFEQSGKRIHLVDVAGIAMILPAAIGVLCIVSRANLSVLSLAAVSILFLVCLISSLAGILTSFWMRGPVFAWGVRLAGIAWLGVCLYIAGTFVLQLAGFSGR